ncbi:MAG: MATE family efflux transporter [Armatimonadia bacterium]|nr:MATE family efflux transporter [Armatimonadia bacterium]
MDAAGTPQEAAMRHRVQSDTSEEPTGSGVDGHDLTVGSIPRHLIRFCLPMLASSGIRNAYDVVNGIWVGKGLGTEAMAAITTGWPVFFFLVSVAIGLTTAANILVAQAYGAKDWAQVRRIVRTSVVLVAVAGGVFIASGELTAEAIFALLQTPDNVFPLAVGYLRVYLISIIPTFGIFLLAALLRGAGDATTPLYFQAGGLLLACGLDPVLMFGWLGFPAYGLMGTAYALIVCQTLAFTAMALYLARRDHLVSPPWLRLRADGPTAWLLLKIGAPVAVQQSLVSTAILAVVAMVNGFGDAAAAAYGTSWRIEGFALLPALTIGAAVSSVAGQNIGAHRYDRVREIFRWALVFSGSITVAAGIPMMLFPHGLLRVFIDDPEVVQIGAGYLIRVAPSYIFFAIMFVSNGVINGAGHTLMTTLISVVSLWGVRVPAAYLISTHMGTVEGVWWGIIIGFGTGATLSLIYYLTGRWEKPVGVAAAEADTA